MLLTIGAKMTERKTSGRQKVPEETLLRCRFEGLFRQRIFLENAANHRSDVSERKAFGRQNVPKETLLRYRLEGLFRQRIFLENAVSIKKQAISRIL